ncbi:hypothetical protein B0H14DRAFT_3477220 [Mycena olivaceomarginata]|nr:hypothetical protein B0H14DRAFT_3477220 [Mycena olivaceomarginata]
MLMRNTIRNAPNISLCNILIGGERPSARQTNLYRIPSALSNTSSTGIFTSTASNLDAPKVLPINASTFDWWYFDVVDTDPNSRASTAVVFYNTGPTGLPFISTPGTTLSAQVIVSFPNGTLSSAPGIAVADRATVLASDNGSSGQWHGAGIAWTHSVYSGAWEILIDSPELGMKGSIHFKLAAPSHYPCGPAVAGQSLAVGPHIGWANAIPDAVSTVLEIGPMHSDPLQTRRGLDSKATA